MKKRGLWFVLIVACLMGCWVPSMTNAAVMIETGPLNPDWSPWPALGGDVIEFETRLGNGALNGDWELGHKFDGVYLDTGGQYAITNGADFDFTLTHDSTSGDFTLSLAGGPSTTWASGNPGEPVQDIWLLAKTSNAAYTSTVKNLVLDGTPVGTILTAVNNKIYLKVYGEAFSDFTLQGTMNFSWVSGTPSGSHIETLISATFPPQTQSSFILLVTPTLGYDLLQAAYDTAFDLGLSADTIKIKEGSVDELTLHFDKNIAIDLQGGFDETFQNATGFSKINGTVIISDGTVKFSNIIIGS